MRVRITGSIESTRVLRSYLEKAGIAVCDRLPKLALHCTIHLSEHSGQHIIVDSVDSPLESHILRHITESITDDVILRRRTGLVSTENEIHLSVPAGDPEAAHAVEVGVLRGVQRAHFHRPWWKRLLLPVLSLILIPIAQASPPRYSLFANTEGGTISISMPPGGLFPQFQTGGSGTSPCSGTTAPAHTYCGNNTGSVSAPAYVSLVSADLPGTITSSTSGNAATATSFASTPSLCSAGQAAIGVLASGNATGCFTPGGLANPMTTLGDIIYGASSGTPTRLGTNSTGTNQFLRSVSSGVPIWVQPTIADIGTGTSTASYIFNARQSMSNTNGTWLWVDDKQAGALYPTCQSAVTAAGSVPTFIFEPGNYSGADCTLPIPNNIVLFSSNNTTEYTNGMNWLYTSSGGTQSFMHANMARAAIPASGAIVTGYFTTTLNNFVQTTGIGSDGSSSESNTTGTFTGTLPVIQGAEDDTTNGSTGGTVTTWAGVLGYGNSSLGSTTAMTNLYGVWGKGCNSMLGAIPVNCYALYGSAQAFGSSRKYSLGIEGQGLLLWDTSKGAAGFDAEDNTHTAHSFISIDNGSPSQTNIQAVTTAGLAFQASNAATQVLISNNSVAFFASPTPQSAAFVDLGKTALPWANLWLGTAATNNFKFQAAATAGARTISILDPTTATTFLPLQNAPPITGSTNSNVFRVTTDFTDASSTALQTITGLSWVLPANTAANYSVECHLSFSQATAVADAFGIQAASLAPTNIYAHGLVQTNATTAYTGGTLATLATTTATNILTFTPTLATVETADLYALVENPSGIANTINIMVSQTTAADVIVVKRGSYCRVY